MTNDKKNKDDFIQLEGSIFSLKIFRCSGRKNKTNFEEKEFKRNGKLRKLK